MWPRDAYVGQFVVCAPHYNPHPEWNGENPSCETVYTIAWVGIDPSDGTVMIDLAEMPQPETDEWLRGFQADMFHPVDESRLDVFRKLLVKPGVWDHADA